MQTPQLPHMLIVLAFRGVSGLCQVCTPTCMPHAVSSSDRFMSWRLVNRRESTVLSSADLWFAMVCLSNDATGEDISCVREIGHRMWLCIMKLSH